MSTISRANVAITDLPWLQKYRPATFDDIVGNEHSINILKNVAKKGNIPNFLLSGPPGTGKTSSIVCLANELYGKELAKRAILELNASDERSVNVIRDKVKAFAQTKVTLPPGLQKFVILDEVDSMVDPAQKALRAIMEQYSDTTRFALACNNEDKIDEAIMSRITKLSFTNLSQEEVALRLLYIIKQENIKYTPEGLQAIIFTADGDMRQAINNLQSTYSGFGMIDEENVYKVCDVPDPKYIMEMLKRCIRYEVKNVFNAVVKLYGDGYSALDIVQTMMKLMKSASENEIEEDYYNDFLMEIAKTELVIKSGTDSELQVIGLVSSLCDIAKSILKRKND
ncbi:P-loop containing nucleoside triphosphate hydrolase protein [Rhizophagus irregularis]|uniref:P-loop containing nucleoside triphosphate hydrolase protein n=1 Tax=Rhizophagus irregularis TaxID=588596 RepID=A0A2I1GGP5_9GLOM|nr:P-loop containing nucleoside triphosphate hydrolase protein [Rhizophagus irregularis]